MNTKDELIEKRKVILLYMDGEMASIINDPDIDLYCWGRAIPLLSTLNKSWDQLMPVIEKIGLETFEDGRSIFPRTFGARNEDTGQFMFRFNGHQLFQSDTLIEAAFEAVYNCITKLKQP